MAAAGLTAWGDTWQADVFAVPSIVDEEAVWAATLEATAGHRVEALQNELAETQERLDFAERLLSKAREERRIE